MNLILNNLQAVTVIIDYYRLTPGSYQFEDYTLVMDMRPVDYGEDDVIKTIQGLPHPITIS